MERGSIIVARSKVGLRAVAAAVVLLTITLLLVETIAIVDADVALVVVVVSAVSAGAAAAREVTRIWMLQLRASAVSMRRKTLMNGRLPILLVVFLVPVLLHNLMKLIAHVAGSAIMIRRGPGLRAMTLLRKVCSP